MTEVHNFLDIDGDGKLEYKEFHILFVHFLKSWNNRKQEVFE